MTYPRGQPTLCTHTVLITLRLLRLSHIITADRHQPFEVLPRLVHVHRHNQLQENFQNRWSNRVANTTYSLNMVVYSCIPPTPSGSGRIHSFSTAAFAAEELGKYTNNYHDDSEIFMQLNMTMNVSQPRKNLQLVLHNFLEMKTLGLWQHDRTTTCPNEVH